MLDNSLEQSEHTGAVTPWSEQLRSITPQSGVLKLAQ